MLRQAAHLFFPLQPQDVINERVLFGNLFRALLMQGGVLRQRLRREARQHCDQHCHKTRAGKAVFRLDRATAHLSTRAQLRER
eukprot:3346580-Alexandrium_andersonii.AAC.1